MTLIVATAVLVLCSMAVASFIPLPPKGCPETATYTSFDTLSCTYFSSNPGQLSMPLMLCNDELKFNDTFCNCHLLSNDSVVCEEWMVETCEFESLEPPSACLVPLLPSELCYYNTKKGLLPGVCGARVHNTCSLPCAFNCLGRVCSFFITFQYNESCSSDVVQSQCGLDRIIPITLYLVVLRATVVLVVIAASLVMF